MQDERIMEASRGLVLLICGFLLGLISGRHMTERQFGWALGITVGLMALTTMLRLNIMLTSRKRDG